MFSLFSTKQLNNYHLLYYFFFPFSFLNQTYFLSIFSNKKALPTKVFYPKKKNSYKNLLKKLNPILFESR